MTPDARLFRLRLAETIAWCRGRASADDPGESLRSPELQPLPDAMPARQGTAHPASPPAAASAVEELATVRARLLYSVGGGSVGAPGDLAGGRLLLSAGHTESVWDGASEAESEGFFDVDDLPPWDTWVAYTEHRERVPPDAAWRTTFYIASWVPPAFLDRAEAGRRVNPIACIHWADELPAFRTADSVC